LAEDEYNDADKMGTASSQFGTQIGRYKCQDTLSAVGLEALLSQAAALEGRRRIAGSLKLPDECITSVPSCVRLV
jgi:hypothetical protein